jgi:hypothetical protein
LKGISRSSPPSLHRRLHPSQLSPSPSCYLVRICRPAPPVACLGAGAALWPFSNVPITHGSPLHRPAPLPSAAIGRAPSALLTVKASRCSTVAQFPQVRADLALTRPQLSDLGPGAGHADRRKIGGLTADLLPVPVPQYQQPQPNLPDAHPTGASLPPGRILEAIVRARIPYTSSCPGDWNTASILTAVDTSKQSLVAQSCYHTSPPTARSSRLTPKLEADCLEPLPYIRRGTSSGRVSEHRYACDSQRPQPAACADLSPAPWIFALPL